MALSHYIVVLTLFRMGFFGAAHGWGGGGGAGRGDLFGNFLKLGSYTLPKKDQKNI